MDNDRHSGSEEAASKPSRSQGRRKSLRKGLFSKDKWTPAKEPSATNPTPVIQMATSTADDDETTPPRSKHGDASLDSSSDSGLLQLRNQLHASAVASAAGLYASTTDDDEVRSFRHPPASSSDSSSYDAIPLHAQVPVSSLQRRRSNRASQLVSLAVVQTPADLALDDDWDYSETERWGWVILLGTWLVFVVGMGSCFGVWSWAWDVGETPYAPPELEDDPTLPITGYYPALIVCTVVMAWIWVVVAWVGMKYFKHSKLTSDDG